jgi:hypothetical protein
MGYVGDRVYWVVAHCFFFLKKGKEKEHFNLSALLRMFLNLCGRRAPD